MRSSASPMTVVGRPVQRGGRVGCVEITARWCRGGDHRDGRPRQAKQWDRFLHSNPWVWSMRYQRSSLASAREAFSDGPRPRPGQTALPSIDLVRAVSPRRDADWDGRRRAWRRERPGVVESWKSSQSPIHWDERTTNPNEALRSARRRDASGWRRCRNPGQRCDILAGVRGSREAAYDDTAPLFQQRRRGQDQPPRIGTHRNRAARHFAPAANRRPCLPTVLAAGTAH